MVLSRAGLAGDTVPVQFDRSELMICLPLFPRRKPRLLGGWWMGSVQDIINILCAKATITKPADPPANDPNGYKRVKLTHGEEPSAHEIIAASELVAAALARCGICPPEIERMTALKDPE